MTSKKRPQVFPGVDTSKLVLGAIASFAIGYFLLNYVATWEDPPLGNTFHIIFGCILIAAAGIVAFLIIKTLYFPKKKRKGSRPVFLDDGKTRTRSRRN